MKKSTTSNTKTLGGDKRKICGEPVTGVIEYSTPARIDLRWPFYHKPKYGLIVFTVPAIYEITYKRRKFKWEKYV